MLIHKVKGHDKTERTGKVPSQLLTGDAGDAGDEDIDGWGSWNSAYMWYWCNAFLIVYSKNNPVNILTTSDTIVYM